jgi:hypothetical protein
MSKAQMSKAQRNPLTKFCKQNELGRLREDQCYIDQRDSESRKPFALQTWHYHPYGSKPQATCYPGQLYKDGHGIPRDAIDLESQVNRNPGYEMTRGKYRHQMDMFPVQMPRVRGWFDANTESSLRGEYDKKPAGCDNPAEKSFIPNTFQDFSALCYDPQDPTYIIPEDTFNCSFKDAKFYQWGGVDSRHDRMSTYRNGCDWKPKNFPRNLSYSNFGY